MLTIGYLSLSRLNYIYLNQATIMEFLNYMMLQGRLSMQVIAEQSSRMVSENRINETSNSCELLIEAHTRIRTLEAENQELTNLINNYQHDHTLAALQKQIEQLRDELRERDLKIQNLERISQKAIMDYVYLQNQLNSLRAEQTPQRRQVTPIPSQLNSPLGLSKINRCGADCEQVSVQCARELVKQQERLALDRSQDKWQHHELFTFDKENLQRHKSPSNAPLKNCFSELEVNQLIRKVHRQEDKSHEKQKLKLYHNYCSSIEKKHSPNTALRKQLQLRKTPALSIKQPLGCGSSFKQQKSMASLGYDKWNETSTTNMTAASANFFTGPNRLLFY